MKRRTFVMVNFPNTVDGRLYGVTLVNSDLTSKLTRTSSSPIVVLRRISARCDEFSTCDGIIFENGERRRGR